MGTPRAKKHRKSVCQHEPPRASASSRGAQRACTGLTTRLRIPHRDFRRNSKPPTDQDVDLFWTKAKHCGPDLTGNAPSSPATQWLGRLSRRSRGSSAFTTMMPAPSFPPTRSLGEPLLLYLVRHTGTLRCGSPLAEVTGAGTCRHHPATFRLLVPVTFTTLLLKLPWAMVRLGVPPVGRYAQRLAPRMAALGHARMAFRGPSLSVFRVWALPTARRCWRYPHFWRYG